MLRPSITDAAGSGSQRRYSYNDVLELKVIKRLLDAGLKLQQARRAVECLRGDLGGELASSQLVLVGSRSVLAHSDGEIVDLLAGGQGVFNILPLSVDLDSVEATPARLHRELPWDEAAKARLDELVESEPVLVRISAAKRLRDAAEREARQAGENRISVARLGRAKATVFEGLPI